jgi:predicted glycoside hydrolase/deacetylase ChbG (UPF0249 family)
MKAKPAARLIIVNADDFGLSAGINRGIIEAHERGIVTSASLMVRWPAAAAAAEYARANPRLSVGLHLDFGEWVYRAGQWMLRYEIVKADPKVDRHGDELRRQLEQFRALVGREPSHLDSHQQRHRSDPVRSIALGISRELCLPLRELASPASYLGYFYGQDAVGRRYPDCITPTSLVKILDEVTADITELSCHPAAELDFESVYRKERLIELRTLCDPVVRAALEERKLQLISFNDVPRERIAEAHHPGVKTG